MNERIYIVHSDTLDKKWVVVASSVDTAANKVIVVCKDLFIKLEADNPNEDIGVDLKVQELEEDVMEL